MPCGILILVSLNFFFGIFIRFMSRPLPFYSEFERTLFLSCMLWSQVVHVAGPHPVCCVMNALGVLPFPLNRTFVHCRFPSSHPSPGLTASPLQVTLLPPHPTLRVNPLRHSNFSHPMLLSIINKREDLILSMYFNTHRRRWKQKTK